ncbi:MAG: 1,4-dihydroxy-2-naphthoate polyprenyltransferase [Streptococcaceae bacterium]|jgi:1,4-dihydroxy-2-naphthoate octaprenyltransferase|nr:1,4-dihydroxy-2-naphthoate polyprenyltransferase [Streptococcaceae bacterium]
MTLKIFLEVVEIKTKIASVFPFLIGVLFSINFFGEFHLGLTLLFLLAMLIFDMTVTAINNYQDYQKAKLDTYKYEHNVIGREKLSPKLVRNMILCMLIVSAVLGIVLTWLTGWMLLFLGAICFFIGIFYTYGPIPLSRMPLGEIFSGFTMGLGIFAMIVYVNTASAKVFSFMLDFSGNAFALSGSITSVLAIFWASLPLVFTIANIMLANNLRDLDTDVKNHRYTLVYYIGRKRGIHLFQVMMLASYLVLILGVLFRVFDWPVLFALSTFVPIRNNLKAHRSEVPAPHSFVYSLKNMVMFNTSYALGLVLSIVWQHLF